MTRPVNQAPPLPPGPPRQPLKTMREMASDPMAFLESLHRQYGDIVSYQMPAGRNCAVFSSELLKEVLQEREAIYPPAHPASPFDVIKAPALARTRGEDHRRLTKLVTTAFSPDRMEVFADRLAHQVQTHCQRFRPGETMDIRYEFEQLAWNGCLDALFGADGPQDPGIARPILRTVKLKFMLTMLPAGGILLRLPLPFLVRALRAARELDVFVYKAIRRASDPAHPGHDVASHFVRATEQGLVDWTFRNDREIRDELYSLLFAAYEAPIVLLVFSAYYLSRNPDVRDLLEREADEVIGDRPMRGADFARLRYAQAVCRELLRVQPPAITMVPRVALEDSVLGGYSIPRGTVMQVGASVLHSRTDYWGENAGNFRPERWLTDSSGETSGCPAEHAFVPFSREPRACRGAHFATVLMVFALAGLARRVRLEPVEQELPERLSTDVAFFSGPILARVKERKERQHTPV